MQGTLEEFFWSLKRQREVRQRSEVPEELSGSEAAVIRDSGSKSTTRSRSRTSRFQTAGCEDVQEDVVGSLEVYRKHYRWSPGLFSDSN